MVFADRSTSGVFMKFLFDAIREKRREDRDAQVGTYPSTLPVSITIYCHAGEEEEDNAHFESLAFASNPSCARLELEAEADIKSLSEQAAKNTRIEPFIRVRRVIALSHRSTKRSFLYPRRRLRPSPKARSDMRRLAFREFLQEHRQDDEPDNIRLVILHLEHLATSWEWTDILDDDGGVSERDVDIRAVVASNDDEEEERRGSARSYVLRGLSTVRNALAQIASSDSSSIDSSRTIEDYLARNARVDIVVANGLVHSPTRRHAEWTCTRKKTRLLRNDDDVISVVVTASVAHDISARALLPTLLAGLSNLYRYPALGCARKVLVFDAIPTTLSPRGREKQKWTHAWRSRAKRAAYEELRREFVFLASEVGGGSSLFYRTQVVFAQKYGHLVGSLQRGLDRVATKTPVVLVLQQQVLLTAESLPVDRLVRAMISPSSPAKINYVHIPLDKNCARKTTFFLQPNTLLSRFGKNTDEVFRASSATQGVKLLPVVGYSDLTFFADTEWLRRTLERVPPHDAPEHVLRDDMVADFLHENRTFHGTYVLGSWTDGPFARKGRRGADFECWPDNCYRADMWSREVLCQTRGRCCGAGTSDDWLSRSSIRTKRRGRATQYLYNSDVVVHRGDDLTTTTTTQETPHQRQARLWTRRHFISRRNSTSAFETLRVLHVGVGTSALARDLLCDDDEDGRADFEVVVIDGITLSIRELAAASQYESTFGAYNVRMANKYASTFRCAAPYDVVVDTQIRAFASGDELDERALARYVRTVLSSACLRSDGGTLVAFPGHGDTGEIAQVARADRDLSMRREGGMIVVAREAARRDGDVRAAGR